MQSITVADLWDLLAAQPDLTIIDVRTPAEFASAHVPQARNVPLDALAAGSFSKDQPVYLLCQHGSRATRAAGKLAEKGLDNAVVVTGGTQAWIDAAFPIERAAGPQVMSLERQVRIAAGSLVLTGFVLSRLVHPALIGLSVFVGAGLVFAGISDWCGMGLLLARAPWNRRP